jgi:hypothetical protein
MSRNLFPVNGHIRGVRRRILPGASYTGQEWKRIAAMGCG